MSTPAGGGSGGTDYGDVVLQQAQMVLFCIKKSGPALAAAASILEAVYDAFGKGTPKQTYSVQQAIDDTGTYIVNTLKSMQTDDNLTTILGWQNHRAGVQKDIRNWSTTGRKDVATSYEAFFLNLPNYDKMWATFGDVAANDDDSSDQQPAAPSTPTEDMVTALEMYATARTSYHSLAVAILMYLALADGDTTDGWMKVGSPVRTRLEDSLAAGIAHIDPIATFLSNAATSTVTQAKAAVASITDPVARNVAFTNKLRTLRHDNHLDVTTPKKMAFYASIADTFRQTQTELAKSPLPPLKSGTTPGGAGAGLGPRLPKTARFLFETSPTGTWVDVVANSPVSAGLIATQDAGSAKPGLYYLLGGLGVNGQFTTQLGLAGQLSTVQALLTAPTTGAYDTCFGDGTYATDAAANPTRQDRLTSFLIPLTSPAPPVEDRVVAMVYSAAPQLGSAITDTVTYQQIYADALTAIAAWNAKHPMIENLRVTMLGTGINAQTPSPALNAQAAGLIVDAVLAALKTHPLLATLTILVNTNDSAGGAERAAFTAAAKAKGVSATQAGFDIAWT